MTSRGDAYMEVWAGISVECGGERWVGGEKTDTDDKLFFIGIWLKVRREKWQQLEGTFWVMGIFLKW